jgi:ABC-2 type transport system ATP-binding protein
MPIAPIEVRDLTKRYGDTVAVDHLSFEVRPGRVTGFLGPNGAGKSTTLRMIVGLDTPSSGTALVGGRPYAALRHPLTEIGALLDPRAFHPGRSARRHLQALAIANGLPTSRTDAVLDLVGLGAVADRRAGGFSLGMGQRLGIAAALLGDPGIIVLDEPLNGLDPEGILWLRRLLRRLADEGRTVVFSSHLMGEVALTADHLVVIGRGHLLADQSVDAFVAAGTGPTVTVRTPQPAALVDALRRSGVTVSVPTPGELSVTGATSAEVGDIAAAHGVTVHELREQRPSLEAAFMELTGDSTEYRSTAQTQPASTTPTHRRAA